MICSLLADSLCGNKDCSSIEQFADGFSLLVLFCVLVSFSGFVVVGCGFVISTAIGRGGAGADTGRGR